MNAYLKLIFMCEYSRNLEMIDVQKWCDHAMKKSPDESREGGEQYSQIKLKILHR